MSDLGFGGVGALAETAGDFLSGPFDIFGSTEVENVAVRGRPRHFKPMTANLNDLEVEFHLTGTTPNYMFMSSCALHVVAHIEREDGEDWRGADLVVAPVNLYGPSLFSAVELDINNYQASDLGTSLFPYKNYFDIMTSFGGDAQKTWLPMLGFYPDTAGRFDSISNDPVDGNHGYTARRQKVNNGRKFEFVMPVLNDFLRSDKALIPNLNLKIRFKRSNPRFYLTTGDGASLAANFEPVIDDMTLFAHYVETTAAMRESHVKQHIEKPIRMPIKKTVIKSFDIPVDTPHKIVNNVVDGILPSMMLFGMVSSRAFSGHYSLNPFHFHHYGLEESFVYVNSVQMPLMPLRPRFDDGLYLRDYYELLSNLKMYGANVGSWLTAEQFAGGMYLQAYDLTPDRCAGFHRHPTATGNVSMELKFRNPTENAITLICYLIYDAEVKILKTGEVEVKLSDD